MIYIRRPVLQNQPESFEQKQGPAGIYKKELIISVVVALVGVLCVLYALFSRNYEWIVNKGVDVSRPPIFTPKTTLLTNFQAYDKGVLYTTENDALSARDKSFKKEIWRVTLDSGYVFATPPTVFLNYVFAGDTTGRLYAFYTNSGKIAWEFFHNPTKQSTAKRMTPALWFGEMIFTRDTVVLGARDGVITALYQRSGKTKWTYAMDDAVSSLESSAGTIFATSFSGQMVALSSDGHLLWSSRGIKDVKYEEFPGKESILTRFFMQFPKIQVSNFFVRRYLSVLSMNAAGDVVSRDMRTGAVLYHATLGSQTTTQPALWADSLFVGTDAGQGTVTKMNLITGSIVWAFGGGDTFSATPIIGYRNILSGVLCSALSSYSWTSRPCLATVFVGDYGGNFYAIDEFSGALVWQFRSSGPITASAVIHNRHVVFGNLAGDLYQVFILDGKTPKKIGWQNITVKQNKTVLSGADVLELTLAYPDDYFLHPWNDVAVAAQFKNDKGVIFNINGYYYDKNTWKVIFNPPKEGKWSYVVQFQFPDFSTVTRRGVFTSDKSNKGSYLKTVYIRGGIGRLTADGQTVFSVLGVQNTEKDSNCDGNVLDDFAIGGDNEESTKSALLSCFQKTNTHTLDEFLSQYGDGSRVFNTFRFGFNNASFSLVQSMSPGYYQYLPFEGRAADALAKSVVSHGLHLWMTMFDPTVLNDTLWNSSPLYPFLAKQYIKYIVARYGAYVSVWELTNEMNTDDAIINVLATYLKSLDYESRPISASFEKPELWNIDVISPHWYENAQSGNFDTSLLQQVYNAKYNTFGKPVIFGEIGNKTFNWDPLSATQMRVRAWAAAMNNIGLIFWNMSENKNYVPPTGPGYNGNQYIGTEERDSVRALNSFMAGVKINSSVFSFNVDTRSIRSYGISDDSKIRGYFYRYSDAFDQSPITVSFVVPSSGFLQWYDTKSGNIIKQVRLNKGAVRVLSPPFAVDIAAVYLQDSQ